MYNKKLILVFIALFAITGFASYIYYKSICSTGVCSSSTINNILRPVELGSSILVCFFLVLILLPTRYYKNWFKYIFSWGFPLSVYMTYITTGSSSIPAYGKVEVVKFWGMFFAVVSVLFVAVMYLREKRNK